MIYNIKNHKVQNADIMQGIDNLMLNEKADFIYSDPPWGQGNLKYWQTMNVKMNNAKRRVKMIIPSTSFFDFIALIKS